jgi:excisionase family DNA binding protein
MGPTQNPQSPPDRLAYRPAELAALVGLSAKAIYRAIDRGELRATKVANGSRLLIPARAAIDWLGENSVASERPPASLRPQRARRPRSPLADAFGPLEAA